MTKKKAKPKRGRPSLLTDERRDAIVQHIEESLHPEVAAQCEGISPRTFMLWMARGKAAFEQDENGEDFDESDVPYFAFYAAVTRAKALAEKNTLNDVRSALDTTGNALNAKFLLERRFGERWGNKLTVDVRDQAAEHVIELLREGYLRSGQDTATFEECLGFLCGTSGSSESEADHEDEGPLPLH